MEFLNSTTTGATVGSWLYRVANAPEYESSVLYAIGPGQVTVLGQSTVHFDHSYPLANISIPTDPHATVHRTPPTLPTTALSRPATASAAISSTSPSSLVAGLTQMARGAAEHLVATVVTSPLSPTFSGASTAPATTSVSTVTSTPTMLTHRSTPVDVPTSLSSSHPRSRHSNRTESWAILDSDTADFISSYVATNGGTPAVPPSHAPRANGAVTDSLANLALTESAIDVAAWHLQPSPPAHTHLSGSPVFIPNLASPRSSRPIGGTSPSAAARESPPGAERGSMARRLSAAKLSSSVISMPDDDEDEDEQEEDDEFSDSDRSMSVIGGSSSGEVPGAGGAGNDTVVLDMMGASAFADSSSGSGNHARRQVMAMEEEDAGSGSGHGGMFTLVTTIPGTTPPQTTAPKPRARKPSMDLDDFLHTDDDLEGDSAHHHPRTRPVAAAPARRVPAPHPCLPALLSTWHALPWFTYRTGLDHNTFRSDTGWGCMHRTVQMLVARAFLACVFDAPHVSAKFATRERGYRAVMDLFVDNVPDVSGGGGAGAGGAFALPKICEVGAQQFGVRPGAWFSPTVAAQVMHRLNDRRRVAAGLRASSELLGGTAAGLSGGGGNSGANLADELMEIIAKHPLGNAVDLVTHVAMDGMITPEPVVGKAFVMGDAPNGKPLVVGAEEGMVKGDGGRWRPLLLMVPVRLGLDEIGKQYVPSLVDVFTWPQFVGCAGGRKDASLYFAGTWTRPTGSGGTSRASTGAPDETETPHHQHKRRAEPIVTHWSPPRPSDQPPSSPELSASPSFLARTSLLFLDPHFPQPIPPPTSSVPNPSYHTSVIRALPMSRLDPCMLLGFLFRTHRDWEDFLDRANAWDTQAALFSVPDGWSALSRPSTADGSERNRPRKRDDDQGKGAGQEDYDDDVPFGLDSGLLDQVNVEPVPTPLGSRLRQPTPIKPDAAPTLSSLPSSTRQVSKLSSIPPPIPTHMSRIPKPSSLPSPPACRVDLKCRGPVPSCGTNRSAGEFVGKGELVSPYVHISPKAAAAATGAGDGRGQHLSGHHVPLR